jgi:hypothetical protein
MQVRKQGLAHLITVALGIPAVDGLERHSLLRDEFVEEGMGRIGLYPCSAPVDAHDELPS